MDILKCRVLIDAYFKTTGKNSNISYESFLKLAQYHWNFHFKCAFYFKRQFVSAVEKVFQFFFNFYVK